MYEKQTCCTKAVDLHLAVIGHINYLVQVVVCV